MAIRRAQDPDQRQARSSVDLGSRVKELQASIVATVLPIVQNSAAQITALLGTYLTIAAAAVTYSPLGHKHAASDITSGGTTGAGFTVGGALGVNGTVAATGDVSGGRGVFPTGLQSTGARNNQVTTGYVAMYIDANGNAGFAPSTRASKDIGAPYAVNMSAFLATNLWNWQYKNGGMQGIGPIADELEAAGLTEFLTYSMDGTLQGLRYEALTMGLWSAYVQSRASTLARIGKQLHQTVTVTGMTALTLGGTKAYPITWPAPFADADYMVTASVFSSSGLPVTGVSAASLPSARTTTGCTVQVASGVALLSGQTLIVEAIHI